MDSKRDEIYFRKSLTYANGYREMGMYKDALEELGSVAESFRERDAVYQMRLVVNMEAEYWSAAEGDAIVLAGRHPEDHENAVNLAYVTRRSKSLETAREVLLEALVRFPKAAIIRFNLACYACQSDELEQAKELFSDACDLDGEYLKMGLEDEDLLPIREWIASK